ncbi:MAG: hypothetical protein IJ419_07900 [Agathobacter sp.]|nr:hypothetical protein [Agathobacter sp.]
MEKETTKKIWESLPVIDSEMVKIWLSNLLESKNKVSVNDLTVEEINAEIEETKGTLDNYRVWGDTAAIANCEEYIETLQELLNAKS